MPAWVTRARRRCSGIAAEGDGSARLRIDEQRRVVTGGQTQVCPPLAEPVELGGLRRRTEGQRHELGRRHAGRDERPAHEVGAGQHRLAEELRAQVAELGDGLAVE